MSGVPYLGSRIVLISKSEIRYEGTLYTIDTANSTVALQSVRSFGTEDRKAEGHIPPSSEVFDYIIFRGTDIKDLHVCENPTEPTPTPTPAPRRAGCTCAGGAAPATASRAPAWGANPRPPRRPSSAAPAPAPSAQSKPASGVVRGGRSQPGQGGHIRTTAKGGAPNAADVESDFDFEKMLAGFNKVDVSGEAATKVKATTVAYNKGSSFFDSLDEEIGEPKKGKGFLDEMRKVDALTFGEELIKSARDGQRGGGRGREGGGGGGKGGGKGAGKGDGKGGGKGDGKGRGGGRGGDGGGRGGGRGGDGKGGGKGDRTPREGGKGGSKGDGKGKGKGSRTLRDVDAETFGDAKTSGKGDGRPQRGDGGGRGGGGRGRGRGETASVPLGIS